VSYFTTMNLPAPSYERFQEKLQQYELHPAEAVPDFEAALCRFFEVEAVSTFTNCFTALAMALLYAVRNRPRTVVVAGLAYRRTTDIVMWAGLHPVYVDNDPQTLGMSLQSLEERLKVGCVGCVLVQHPMVHICNPDSYIALCQKYSVPVVLDSVEATGGKHEIRRIGGFGIVEGFSLHPSKVINAAEGGVLTFGQLDEYRSFRKYMCAIGVAADSRSGNNLFRLEPIHAIMGLASLDAYPDMRDQFKCHYLAYREKLKNSTRYHLVEYDLDSDPNFKSVLVELRSVDTGFRGSLIKYLESHDIGARPYYAPLHPMTADMVLPQAQKISERYIFLPIGHSVSIENISYICEKLLAYSAQNQGS
jgi:dTDP-4-amino-4,6-dideoxyglucose